MANLRVGSKAPKKKVEYHSIYAPIDGLHYSTSTPSTMIGEKETPNCSEVVLDKGIVSKQTGTITFGETGDTPLNGSVMHIDQFYDTQGNERLISHTINDVYYYDTTKTHFFNLTQGTVVEDCEDAWEDNANVTATADTTYFWRGSKSAKAAITSTFTTGVAMYENFGAIDLSASTYLHFYIRSSIDTIATDLDIRISEQNAGGTGASYEDVSVPALTANTWQECSVVFSGAAATRNAVLSVSLVVANDLDDDYDVYLDDIRGVVKLTGDEDNQFCSEIAVGGGEELYVFNNYVDLIQKWNMGDATTSDLDGCDGDGADPLVKTKKMIVYGERLCCYHVSVDGTAHPQMVKWPVPGDCEDWTGAGSGYNNLIGVFGVDFIQTAEKIGNYVAIYGERTIALQEYRGTSATTPYSFITRVSGIGLAAPKAIVNLGEEHIFLGWDNVYSYKGGREVEPVGNKIQQELLTILNPEYIHRSFMVFLEEKSEIRLYIPTIGNTTPDTYFSLNIKTNGWSRGLRSYTGFGYYAKQSALTWATMATTWATETMRWDDRTRLTLAPLNLYGNGSGKIYQDDDSLYTIDGSDVDAWWDSKDFVVSERYVKETTNWMGMLFEGRGSSVDIYTSTDFGETYKFIETVTLSSKWSGYEVDFEEWSPQCRVRFRNNGSGYFQFRQFEMKFVRGSDR